MSTNEDIFDIMFEEERGSTLDEWDVHAEHDSMDDVDLM